MSNNYNPLTDTATNLTKLLKVQNAAGASFGEFEGAEPTEVLMAKVLFNAANTGGSLGEVSSVNGMTGVVVLDKGDIGLGNVPNTDATNASNLASGTVPNARFPATLPAASGVNLTALNATQLTSGVIPDARMPNLTGDVTTVEGAVATTLATVNSNVGTFGSATQVAQVTVNAKGLVTGVTNVTISGGGGGSGDVTGPVSSTDNAIVRWNGTAGDTVQNSGVTIDDSDNMSGVGTLTVDELNTTDLNVSGSVVFTSIPISATLGTDDTYRGITITNVNAGATIAQWELVYRDFATGEWMLADANGTSTYPAEGIAVSAGTDGNPLTVLITGFVRNDAWNWSAGQIYLSATPGAATQTAPSTAGDKVQVVGRAQTADIAFFHFNPTYLEVSA